VIIIHPHAKERSIERGTNEEEIVTTVEYGERFTARFGRFGFRRNFDFAGRWRGRQYATKQVEAIAVQEGSDWIVVTVLVKFF
jgi:hypothetical protein